MIAHGAATKVFTLCRARNAELSSWLTQEEEEENIILNLFKEDSLITRNRE